MYSNNKAVAVLGTGDHRAATCAVITKLWLCCVQVITELRRELSRAQISVERLQAQLASESKTRSDVENRNTTLEHEMTKVRGRKHHSRT